MNALLSLRFTEIIGADDDVLFFQRDERLVALRRYPEGLDEIQIRVICENIEIPFEVFISLMD